MTKKHSTWDVNHVLIQDAFVLLFSKLSRQPTQKQISKESGLSQTTVQKHFKELKLESITPFLKIRGDKILNKMAAEGEDGNVAAAKLFLQVVFGWSEKTGINISGEIKTKSAIFIAPDMFDSVEEWEEHEKKKKVKKS